MKQIKTFIITIFFLLPCWVMGQARFSTIADELTITTQDVLQVQYVVENAEDFTAFKTPEFRDFRIVQGPVETTGMSFMNNTLTRYKAISYVLQPLKSGRLLVPGAQATVDGKKMVSNKLMIEVADAGKRSPTPVSPINPGISGLYERPEEDYTIREGESATEKIRENLMVKLETDKTSAYVGEPIVATYKLYTRLRSQSRVSKRPSMNGFSVYDMVEPDGSMTRVEKLNGKSFTVHLIRQTQLLPLQEGKYELEPVELENNIRFLRLNKEAGPVRSGRTPLEQMFEEFMDEERGKWEEHQVTLTSSPATITIKPLPSNAPESFNGAVGNFTLSARMVSNTVGAGDNGNLELVLEGSGNLPLVNAPQINWPKGLDSYDPTTTENINKTVAPMAGKKTFTYAFTSSTPGKYELGPVAFSYFDPASKTYKTLQTERFTISITPSSNRKPATAPTGSQGGETPRNQWPVWLGAGLSILLLAGGILFWTRRRRKKIEPVEEANPPAVPVPVEEVVAIDRLLDAKQAAANNDIHGFYQHIERVLGEIVYNKVSLPPSSQLKQEALKRLAEKGIPQETLADLQGIWQEIDWVRYAAGSTSAINQELLVKSEKVMDAVDRLS
ncbi:BatD family protein [Flavihumibacter rivuli]|uniref:BatD family protein n=1 Tax=Flavihumibacter rivuli TaxID=2838156 RepID=UPI001BDE4580|nr:BatD family protein [Flavihumibacter rivuli]ULQ56131.1 BatD family protein [Flavihumibacter rivuli]